jgi:hypothetical protein
MLVHDALLLASEVDVDALIPASAAPVATKQPNQLFVSRLSGAAAAAGAGHGDPDHRQSPLSGCYLLVVGCRGPAAGSWTGGRAVRSKALSADASARKEEGKVVCAASVDLLCSMSLHLPQTRQWQPCCHSVILPCSPPPRAGYSTPQQHTYVSGDCSTHVCPCCAQNTARTEHCTYMQYRAGKCAHQRPPTPINFWDLLLLNPAGKKDDQRPPATVEAGTGFANTC